VKSIRTVLPLAIQYLKDKEVENARRVAESLLSYILKKKRIELYMHFDLPLQEQELDLFRSFLRRATLEEPVEYITGEVDFYGCTLHVGRHVLIPRVETELMVDMAAKWMEEQRGVNKVLWDICSGSGCIGLSLKKKFPEFLVSLSDICLEALKICKQNARQNHVEVEIVQGDLLAPFQGRKADYILCNPPYVTQKEYESLKKGVKDYEPAKALVGGASGLEFYERLSREIPSHLNPGGRVFLEIGFSQGEAVEKIFNSTIWRKKEKIRDFAGLDRFFFLEME
jgi:release factor glutamine methyltransferase